MKKIILYHGSANVSIGTVLIDTLFRLKTNGGKIKVAAPHQGNGYL